LLPDTQSTGEWTAVGVIVGVTVIVAVVIAARQSSGDDTNG